MRAPQLSPGPEGLVLGLAAEPGAERRESRQVAEGGAAGGLLAHVRLDLVGAGVTVLHPDGVRHGGRVAEALVLGENEGSQANPQTCCPAGSAGLDQLLCPTCI